MSGAHVGLALLVVVIWGAAFVATKLALESFSPPALAAARFLIAAVPALFLARPPIAWPTLVVVGTFLFTGQFLFQFFGIAWGAPPGLAAVVVQTQALFTIVLSALALGEVPTGRQLAGTAVAVSGLAVIAGTVGDGLSALGLALTTLSAVSWAIGNVLLKRLPAVDPLTLAVWLSLVPPLPALALALATDGPAGLAHEVTAASWPALGAAVYLGAVATVLGYAIWGLLLRQYPAAAVTPFALLVPFVAALGSAIVFAERFGPLRLLGMALVLVGLAVIVLPARRPPQPADPVRLYRTGGRP
jgi:O-acetylserine/cysteine efflux transporter